MVQIMQQEMEIKKDSSSKYLVFGLVLSGLMARNRSFIIYAAVLGSVLNAAGFMVSPPGGEWGTDRTTVTTA